MDLMPVADIEHAAIVRFNVGYRAVIVTYRAFFLSENPLAQPCDA